MPKQKINYYEGFLDKLADAEIMNADECKFYKEYSESLFRKNCLTARQYLYIQSVLDKRLNEIRGY